MRVYQSIAIAVTVGLGIGILMMAGFAMPSIVREIVHPTGSFAGPINRYLAQLGAAAIAIASGVEGLLWGLLLRQHWIQRSVGNTAIVVYGAIAALSLFAVAKLQH